MQKVKSLVAVVTAFLMLMSNALPVLALGEITPSAPAVDICPNVDGTQVSIPTGMIVDGSGNCVTPIPLDSTAPVISGVASLSLATTEATLVWTTDELAVSHLEYGTTTSYGVQPTLDASALLAHTAILTGLAANTTYYYCIHATDLSNNTANSCGHSFTTAANPIIVDSTPPNITLITVALITTTSATIGWTTSEIANAEVEYGNTAGYGNITPLDTNFALTHSVSILNLQANTLYHYRIKTSDEIGNQTVSPDETFTTEAVSVNVVIQIPADTTPPLVSEAGAISIGTTSVTLGWTTNELAISTLEYGTTTNYGTQATLSISALLSHTATLTGLTSGTTYYYCIHSVDIANNTANSCGHSFTTESASAPADATAPIISLVASTPTNSAATIAWTTNELANTQVQYGTTTNYGSTTDLDPILGLTHSVNITGLSSNTTYHYRVKSSDDSGNMALSSDQTFTTETEPQVQVQTQTQTQTQTPSSSLVISAIETTFITTLGATITWQTDLPSDSQISYGNSENLGSLTILDTTLTTNHSVTLIGLSQNTNYIFKVKSKPVGALLTTTSSNQEFDTLSQNIPIVPPANILSVSSSGITTTGATVTWTTDKNTTAQIEYGISTSYGELSTLNQTMQTSHTISLADLAPNTTYHYRVKSTDEASNITYSEDYTFTTSPAIVSPPLAIMTLAIGGYDNNSVALVWNASTAHADATAEYDVRYNTVPVTEGNFETSTPVQISPILYVDLSPNGTKRTYIVAGLNKKTEYYFAVKSKFGASSYSGVSNSVSITTTSNASVTTESTTPGLIGGRVGSSVVSQEYGSGSGGTSSGSFEPTLVKAELVDSEIIFSWHNPGESNFVRTIVVRKEGSYPNSPTDGKTIYEGRSETFTDTNVQNDTTYYYAIYSYNHAKTYSNGIKISLAPSAQNKEITFDESSVEDPIVSVEHFTKVFKKGDKDIEIEHLQEVLSADGDSYQQKYITGYFGSLTETALKSFQAKHGLLVTGIVDAATQKELNTVASSQERLAVPIDYVVFGTDMKLKDQGDNVAALQQYLIYEGSLSSDNNNGYFGKNTKAAVQAFQKKYGIQPVSGYVGYKTRHRMQQLAGL